jgi:hypothetical protein
MAGHLPPEAPHDGAAPDFTQEEQTDDEAEESLF